MSVLETTKPNRYRPATVLVGVALLWTVPAVAADYSEESAAACIDCHDTPAVMGIVETAHANFDNPRTPAAQRQCQSCHGPSATHMRFPLQIGNVHFGSGSANPPAQQNAMCAACHGTREQEVAWESSAHGYEDLVCNTCHSVHDPDKIVPKHATISSGCAECHGDLMAASTVPEFSHAVGRKLGEGGELTCAGCHNPHGPLESSRCLDCHAQTPEVLALQTPKARRYHEVAAQKGTECMRCHKGIAHPIKPLEELIGMRDPKSPLD